MHTLQRNRFPKEKIEMRQQSHCVLETVSKPFTVFLSFWASLNTYLAVFLSVLYTSYPRIHISKWIIHSKMIHFSIRILSMYQNYQNETIWLFMIQFWYKTCSVPYFHFFFSWSAPQRKSHMHLEGFTRIACYILTANRAFWRFSLKLKRESFWISSKIQGTAPDFDLSNMN